MASATHEEEVLGKAYDSRLMRRLLTYLRPYKWQVALGAKYLSTVTLVRYGPTMSAPDFSMMAASASATCHW